MKKGYLKKTEWCLSGRKTKGRLRNSWMQEVTIGMRDNEINMEWIDQERMEKKNKTLGTERCESIDTLYINYMQGEREREADRKEETESLLKNNTSV